MSEIEYRGLCYIHPGACRQWRLANCFKSKSISRECYYTFGINKKNRQNPSLSFDITVYALILCVSNCLYIGEPLEQPSCSPWTGIGLRSYPTLRIFWGRENFFQLISECSWMPRKNLYHQPSGKEYCGFKRSSGVLCLVFEIDRSSHVVQPAVRP